MSCVTSEAHLMLGLKTRKGTKFTPTKKGYMNC